MKTVGQLLKHDFKTKGSLYLYDSNGKIIYYENSYFENSTGYWYKKEFDSNGKEIYFEDSNNKVIDNRPESTCDGKVVEIDGKKYQLKLV